MAAQAEEGLRRFTFERAEMGVPFRVTLFAAEEVAAQRAAEAALHRVWELNGVLSDYDSDSELSQLSQSSGQGKRVRVGEDLWRVLEFGQRMAVRSEGAFDLTVGPVVNLWRTARRKRELPGEERLAEALGRVGYGGVRLFPEDRSVELQKPRMRLDAGGIAKGYAVQEALRVLRGLGFGSAMVVGGGDMALGEAPVGESGWRIEVPALDAPGAPAPEVLTLKNVHVSTSGDRYQRLERDGKRYSHVLDPRTGMALTDHSLVTVIASHGMEAEVLAKILSVLGPEKGLPILEEIPGAAARFVRAPEGRVEAFFSERWPREGR
jgi:thiamine biosynthesis lipoprotein